MICCNNFLPVGRQLRLILFLITVSLLNSCGTVKSDSNHLKISVNHSEIYCWLNLMPGGPASFHITGNLKIKNEESYELKELNLKEIIITQEDKPVYTFKPVFEPLNESIHDKILDIEEEKVFHFGVKNGLEVISELDPEKNITARFKFNSGKKIFEYVIPDIKIEKAY